MSRQIQDLEEEVGTPLFIRSRHTLQLTDAGERFLVEAREIVKRCNNLREVVLDKDDNTAGTLKIAYQAFLDTRPIYQALRTLTKKNKHIDLSLLRCGNQKIERELLLGNCDLAYTMQICLPNTQGLTIVPLQENRLQIAVPKEHPYANRSSVSISDLKKESFIMLERQNSPLTVDYAVGLCTASGFSPRTAHYVDNIETALILVGAGQGITFLFSAMNVNKDDVVILDIDHASDNFNCVLAYKDENQNPTIPLLLEAIEK